MNDISKKVTPKIIEEYKNGNTSIPKIAKETHAGYLRVRKYIYSLGFKPRFIKFESSEEIESEMVKEYNTTDISLSKLAKKHHGDIYTIKNILIKYGCKIDEQKRYNMSFETQNNIKKDYVSGMDYRELGIKYNIGYKTIEKLIKKDKNIRVRVDGRFLVNDNSFSGELNEEKAYWVGFMMADGSINGKNNNISIGLNSIDKEHLLKFAKFINIEKPEERVKTSTRTHQSGFPQHKNLKEKPICISTISTITITSKQMCEDFKKYGVIPRKTYVAEAKGGIENNPHFWRGVMDGDGWLTIDKNNNITVGLCGNKKLIKQFNDFAKFILNNGKKYCEPKKGMGHCWKKTFGGSSAIKIIKILYENATVSLNRKMEKAHKIINWRNN